MTNKQIIILLLDNLEYLESGLCALSLSHQMFSLVGYPNIKHIRNWVDKNKPNTIHRAKTVCLLLYSWPQGSVDHRYYWLKSKLKEYENN